MLKMSVLINEITYIIVGDLLFFCALRACNSIGGNRLCVRSPACACACALLCMLFNGNG